MISDIELAEKVKLEKDSNSLLEISSRHSGMYYDVVNRYASAYPNVIKHSDMEDEKLFNLYKFVTAYDPNRGMKLSSYIGSRTNFLCKTLLHDSRTNALNNALEIGEKEESFDASGHRTSEKVDPMDGSYNENEVEEHSDTALILEIAEKYCKDERAVEIIKLRHLNETGRPKTLREIGKYFNISYERVRQIYNVNMEIIRKQIIHTF